MKTNFPEQFGVKDVRSTACPAIHLQFDTSAKALEIRAAKVQSV
jgi:hypothetical protein